MPTTRKQLVKRIVIWVPAIYLLLVVITLSFNASLKAYLGVTFGWNDALECVCGPAITMASVPLIFAVVWVAQMQMKRFHSVSSK